MFITFSFKVGIICSQQTAAFMIWQLPGTTTVVQVIVFIVSCCVAYGGVCTYAVNIRSWGESRGSKRGEKYAITITKDETQLSQARENLACETYKICSLYIIYIYYLHACHVAACIKSSCFLVVCAGSRACITSYIYRLCMHIFIYYNIISTYVRDLSIARVKTMLLILYDDISFPITHTNYSLPFYDHHRHSITTTMNERTCLVKIV